MYFSSLQDKAERLFWQIGSTNFADYDPAAIQHRAVGFILVMVLPSPRGSSYHTIWLSIHTISRHCSTCKLACKLPILLIHIHHLCACSCSYSFGLGARSCRLNLSSSKKHALTVLPPKNLPPRSTSALVASSMRPNLTKMRTASSGLKPGSRTSKISTLCTPPYLLHSMPTCKPDSDVSGVPDCWQHCSRECRALLSVRGACFGCPVSPAWLAPGAA